MLNSQRRPRLQIHVEEQMYTLDQLHAIARVLVVWREYRRKVDAATAVLRIEEQWLKYQEIRRRKAFLLPWRSSEEANKWTDMLTYQDITNTVMFLLFLLVLFWIQKTISGKGDLISAVVGALAMCYLGKQYLPSFFAALPT